MPASEQTPVRGHWKCGPEIPVILIVEIIDQAHSVEKLADLHDRAAPIFFHTRIPLALH
jgi:hypothetical protein